MKIFTMGSSGKTAEEFFNNIDKNKVELYWMFVYIIILSY